MLSFQIKASHLHICPKWLCQPEIGYATPHFIFKINTPTIRLSLHCSIKMVGGHEKRGWLYGMEMDSYKSRISDDVLVQK
jgi:hypothetical protein